MLLTRNILFPQKFFEKGKMQSNDRGNEIETVRPQTIGQFVLISI